MENSIGSDLLSLAGLNKIGNGPDIFEDVLSKIKNAEARNNELKNSRKQQESTNFHLRLRIPKLKSTIDEVKAETKEIRKEIIILQAESGVDTAYLEAQDKYNQFIGEKIVERHRRTVADVTKLGDPVDEIYGEIGNFSQKFGCMVQTTGLQKRKQEIIRKMEPELDEVEALHKKLEHLKQEQSDLEKLNKQVADLREMVSQSRQRKARKEQESKNQLEEMKNLKSILMSSNHQEEIRLMIEEISSLGGLIDTIDDPIKPVEQDLYATNYNTKVGLNGFQKVSKLIADNPRFRRYPGELGSDFNHPEKGGSSLNGSDQAILEMGDCHGFEKDEDGLKQFAGDGVEENVNPILESIISKNFKSSSSPDLKKYKFASLRSVSKVEPLWPGLSPKPKRLEIKNMKPSTPVKNVIPFRNTSAGGVERFENSAGGVESLGISAGGVERFDSSHGVVKSFKSSAGGVERFDSSHGVVKSFKSSAGGVERFESLESSHGWFKDSPQKIQIQPSPEEHKKLFSQNLNCYVNTKGANAGFLSQNTDRPHKFKFRPPGEALGRAGNSEEQDRPN